MIPLSPADELAEIRTKILRLRARELVLRHQILSHPERHSQGRWHQVVIDTHTACDLDLSQLPGSILNDPGFWRERQVQTLHCRPLTLPAPRRPGWPIRLGGASVLH